jgi:hypothetical protein
VLLGIPERTVRDKWREWGLPPTGQEAFRWKNSRPNTKRGISIAAGTTVENVITRLTQMQAEHPGAQVRRGKRGAWEIWAPPVADRATCDD